MTAELPKNPDPADRTERLLTAAGRHAAPLAHDFLAELRERTTAEFQRAHTPQSLTSTRRWQMLFARALTAAVAVAALFGALWLTNDPDAGKKASLQWASATQPPLAETKFGEAFAKLAAEPYFAAEMEEGGETHYLWGAAGGKLRFDAEPGLYAIVDRDQKWTIDESANRAAVAPADYYYRRESAAAINPWRLMKLEPETGAALAYREEEQVENNAPLLRSYFHARFAGEPVAVEARLDPVKQLPRDLLVWPRENRGALPLLRFHLIQAGGAQDATKFKVAETLTEDGRIGKIVDAQGLVTLRAMASSRWTPIIAQHTLLQPGDWLRTDNRGANAATVQLAPQTKLILGPGTLIELPKPDQLRVTSGVVQVAASEKTPITLTGPDGGQVIIRGKEIWQVAQSKLAKVAKEPVWLKGYVGQIPQETLGSLVALVDGRNVPLSVGYHKVTVEIRDQIARTTIEESFVNHTNAVLEGQFHFPLPQDASISGFGMWIGNELVEADIVEKQRAREIYETILREKRDPGLLEWTGGNIFKARIYPIPGNSEKRIKITYTQVLPLVGDSFRYSYALQSDLLKQNPLKRLELAVIIHSTQPLQQVASPTHATRNQQTPHSARIEFSAQNYTPTRDFEVVTTLTTRTQDLTLIPHQRGEDGFFMLLMQPPQQTGKWLRPLVNDGAALELLILADTSASMDRASRTRQEEVIGALLSALAPKDKFNLATCDVDCLWTFEKSVDAVPEQITKARDVLQKRRSMGWTNLQRGWESALKQASPGAHIIYVGDGIVTRGTQDLAGDVQAIAMAAEGKNVLGHAIAVSSSYESQLLKAIASVGGGSVRHAAGEMKPTQIAHDLLVEATRPSLRNIQVTFAGFRTARVYPPTLPNLPAGTQQVVLGRYLPAGANQKGEVVVRGTLEGKPVAYRANIDLRQAPQAGTADDASFIPRLWARLHLDQLLAEGSSQQVQDQIIGLSEEYHIITPYTSLLVLETDADRERFKVKKRMQMRDGERFFQKGNDEARYALVQQQMIRAQAWRQQLRQKLLARLSNLGRDASLLERQQFDPLVSLIITQSWYENGPLGRSQWGMSMGGGMGGGGMGGGGMGGGGGSKDYLMDVDGPGSAMSFDSNLSLMVEQEVRLGIRLGEDSDLSVDRLERLSSLSDSSVSFDDRLAFDFDGTVLAGDMATEYGEQDGEMLSKELFSRYSRNIHDPQQSFSRGYLRGESAARGGASEGFYFSYDDLSDSSADSVRLGYEPEMVRAMLLSDDGIHDRRTGGLYRGTYPVSSSRQALLPVPVPHFVPRRSTRKIATTWPADAIALIRTLQLEDDLRKLTGGISIDQTEDHFQPRNAELTSRQQTRQLYSPTAWLARGDRERDHAPLLQWCDANERGNQALAFDIALVRKSDAQDLQYLPLLLNDGAYGRWDEMLNAYQVKLEKQAENRVLLIAKAAEDEVQGGYQEFRWLIDTERRVVLESERRQQDKVVDRTTFDKFVRIAGRWFATSAEHFNAEGKSYRKLTLQMKELTAGDFKTEWANEQKLRTSAITFNLPLPKFAEAEKQSAAGTAKIEARLTLLARHYGRNEWTEANTQLAEAEKLAPGKAGWNWIRLVLLEESRRHEELKQLLRQIGDKTVATRHPAEFAVVHKLRQLSTQLTGGNEQLQLLAQLQPAYERFAVPMNGEKQWSLARLESLSSAGNVDDHRDYLAQLAKKYPRDYSLQQQHVSSLRQWGEMAAAFAWIEAALKDPQADWEEHESEQLRALYCDILEAEGRYAEGVKYARAWEELNPKSLDAAQRLLSYLVLSGDEQAAFDLAQAWLKSHVPAAGQPLQGAAHGKVYVAVQFLLGEGRNITRADLDLKHLPLLEKLLLQFAGTEDAHAIAMQIWNQNDFRNSDARQRVLKVIFARVVAEAGTLPSEQLQWLFEIVIGNTHTVEQLKQWKQVQLELERRWAAEKKLSRRATYRALILRVVDHQGSGDRENVLRRFLAGALPAEKDQAVRELFDHILNQAWTAAREAETFKLIEQLSSSDNADVRLQAQVTALYRWVDSWDARRGDFLISKIDRPDKLKRTELEAKQTAARKQAREEISQRLATAAAARKDKNDAFARWLLLEHLTLEIRLERKLPQVADQLWNWLQQSLDQPKPVTKEDDQEVINVVQLALADVWQHRLLKSLLHLAAHKDAPPAQVARLTKLFEEQRQLRLAKPDEASKPVKTSNNHLDWQQLQYELLLARDLPQELQQALRNYITVNDDTGHWRRQLARIHAELNKLESAVQLLEELERANLLASEDYRSLATWYHALDLKQKHESAQVKIYRQQQPWQLDRQIRGQLSRWQQSAGPLPETLEPQVLLLFAALLQTEESPSYYLNTLREFYEVTHDTRLLQAMAKALPGHTAERIYPMLKETWNVLTKVEHEATIDELKQGLEEVRKSAKTPLDQRALDLLEVLAHRRAAELQNGAQPHVTAAVAALQRAEKRDWLTGEPRLMADFLASLGNIAQPALAAEQVRLLEHLLSQAQPGTDDALQMTAYLATTQWSYGRQNRAIDLLIGGCEEYRVASGGKVNQTALAQWFQIVDWQLKLGQSQTGEKTLNDRLPQVANPSLAQQVTHRYYGVYALAIRQGGLTSLGRGEPLYRAVLARSRADAKQNDELNFLIELANQTMVVFQAAHEAKLPTAGKDLVEYAKQDFARILMRQVNGYDNSVDRMANVIHEVAGPQEAIAFLLDRAENEPIWVKYQGNDPWSRSSGNIARWREEAKDLDDLEPRLLRFVIAELKRDLTSRSSRSRVIFTRLNSYFWSEKTAEFAAVAEEVLKQFADSGDAAMHIGVYLYYCLDRQNRALEIMLAAHRRKLLHDDQQIRLVRYLQESGRYGESIALLEPLVKRRPHDLTRRCELMRAYFETKQKQALVDLRQKTHDVFHQKDLWIEGAMQELGNACLVCELYEPAVEYLKEAAAVHVKATGGRSMNDQALSYLYQSLARSYAGLKNTKQAVDAASSAIVCWSRHHNERAHALDALREVLRASPNLPAYVKELDKETAESGQDRPVVRKLLGEVFQEQGKTPEAIVQYRAAVQLSPGDAEIHAKLIECLDAQNDAAGALAQSFDSLELNRRNLELWQNLAQRFDVLNDTTEAERARTSLAEVIPSETEGHTLLAQQREEQDRWPEALEQWQQVARLRKLEPTGLLNVARAQLHLKEKDSAAASIKQLESTTWPPRFNAELQKSLPELKEQLRK